MDESCQPAASTTIIECSQGHKLRIPEGKNLEVKCPTCQEKWTVNRKPIEQRIITYFCGKTKRQFHVVFEKDKDKFKIKEIIPALEPTSEQPTEPSKIEVFSRSDFNTINWQCLFCEARTYWRCGKCHRLVCEGAVHEDKGEKRFLCVCGCNALIKPGGGGKGIDSFAGSSMTALGSDPINNQLQAPKETPALPSGDGPFLLK